MGHFILSNSWCLCILFRIMGIYPFKKNGNSELIPTSKFQFWFTYILTLIVVLSIGIPLFVVYFSEVSFDCWSEWNNILEAHNLTKTEKVVWPGAVVIICLMHLYCIFKCRHFAKELSIIQENFNSIELMIPDHSVKMFIIVLNKIPIYYQNRSKKVIILICIIPFLLGVIGLLCELSGIHMNHFYYISTTTACHWNGYFPHYFYIIIATLINSIFWIFLSMPSNFFYIISIDISHLFLSWSESIIKAKGMERSTLLSQTMSFIRILNHYKKILSPVIFWMIPSLFILTIFSSYLTLIHLISNPMVNDLHLYYVR